MLRIKKRLYIVTANGIFSLQGQKEIRQELSFEESMRITAIECIKNELWVLSETKGLFIWDISKKCLKYHFKYFLSDTHNKIPSKCMHVESFQRVWIGTQRGLFLLNLQEQTYEVFTKTLNNQESLVNNSIWSIFKDENNNLWIGTYSGGICLLSFEGMETFKSYALEKYDFTPTPVSSFALFHDKIWIGTEGGGIYTYEADKGITHILYHDDKNSLAYDNVKTLLTDKTGNLWIGMYRGGIDCYNFANKKIKNYTAEKSKQYLLSDEVYKFIAEADSGMWVIYQLDGMMLTYFPFKEQLSKHYFFYSDDSLKEKRFVDICRDKNGYLWLATYNKLFRFNVYNKKIEEIPLPKGRVYNIRSLFLDDTNLLWIGTQNQGLLNYNIETGKIIFFDSIFKNQSVTISSMITDGDNNLWLGTNRGLFRLDTSNKVLQYDASDGIQSSVFYPNAVCKTKKGDIYFGNTEGVIQIFPYNIKPQLVVPRVLISDFFVNSNSILFSTSNDTSIIQQFLLGNEIVLTHRQNNIKLELASTNFLLSKKTRYRYRLCGFEDEWTEVDSQLRNISYPQLPSGNYIFEAMAANQDGVWGECIRVKMFISPAPWRSWWAYLSYSVSLGVLFYILYSSWQKSQRLKNEIYIASIHEKELEKNHQDKLQFFTNITHEFKTPLTLILGTLDSMKEDKLNIPDFYMDILKNHSRRLLNLVNEVIDFRMVENGIVKLNVQPANLNKLIRDCISDVWNYAMKKHIKLHFVADYALYKELLFDYGSLEKIILNLLDNALKYTHSDGIVNVITYADISSFSPHYSNSYMEGKIENNKKYWGIVFQDTGIGISLESIPYIFVRFFRINDVEGEKHLGSGIGLALVKALVLANRGFITIYSEKNVGTDIVVGFPYIVNESHGAIESGKQEVVLMNDYQTTQEDNSFSCENEYLESDKKRILLVEDDKDLCFLIKRRLSKYYNFIDVPDGEQALKVLDSQSIDLILSDWMMDNMDGISLCKSVKEKKEKSHIPFILMTVKNTIADQLEGYNFGIDGFVGKPINFELLKKKIDNFLSLKDDWFSHYANTYFIKEIESISDKEQKEFLSKFISILEDGIATPDTSVESLANAMSMSRRKLLTLVKEYTGKSVVEFIRSYKMRYAARLLIEKGMTIKEVLPLIGIESSSYFSKAFKNELGETPAAFIAKRKKTS